MNNEKGILSAGSTIYIVEDSVGDTEIYYTFEDSMKCLQENQHWKVHAYRRSESFGRLS